MEYKNEKEAQIEFDKFAKMTKDKFILSNKREQWHYPNLFLPSGVLHPISAKFNNQNYTHLNVKITGANATVGIGIFGGHRIGNTEILGSDPETITTNGDLLLMSKIIQLNRINASIIFNLQPTREEMNSENKENIEERTVAVEFEFINN